MQTKYGNSSMVSNSDFIGRAQELEKLTLLLKKKSASLVVIKGRRRIGKSRLIQEFVKALKNYKTYFFSGAAPTAETTLQSQFYDFGWQLGKALKQPPFKDDDWNTLFLRLANNTRKDRVIIVLDEISWIGSEDDSFLSKLKNAWDLEFKQNPNLMLVLCGSISSWIDENILNSTGFVGRISLVLTLEELALSECNEFWNGTRNNISAYEKFKILSITGGVPKYLEEIHPHLSAEENIKNLCFDRSGLLFNEFEQIFVDIFSRRSETYKRIVQCLADGIYEVNDIYKKLKTEKSGIISEYLDNLTKSGFVRRYYTWDIKNGKTSKFSRYRISDNYLRFYLKYIAPNRDQIARNSFHNKSLAMLPGWDGIMGLQFENLVLNNRQKIMELLHINPSDVVYDNPYFQNKTTRQESCQIDYLIQTRFDTLYVCEIKFARGLIKNSVITEMREKIKRLKAARYFSCRPILIHVNGVSANVLESRYFSNVIDFAQLLVNK